MSLLFNHKMVQASNLNLFSNSSFLYNKRQVFPPKLISDYESIRPDKDIKKALILDIYS